MYEKSEQTEAAITTEILASLGADHLVYIKPMLIDGQPQFGIFSASGSQIAAAPTREVAFALAVQNGVEPVSVH